MESRQIILDTNVLYAGLYSSSGASYQILRALENGKIRAVLSIPLLFEYEDVLKRDKSRLKLSEADIDVVLDNICALGIFQKIFFLWRPYLRDPKDDHILEVAVASRTPVIVTHNIKDFYGTEKFGVRATPPADMLEVIRWAH